MLFVDGSWVTSKPGIIVCPLIVVVSGSMCGTSDQSARLRATTETAADLNKVDDKKVSGSLYPSFTSLSLIKDASNVCDSVTVL